MRSTDYVTAVAEALLDTTDPNATDLQAGGQRINGHFHNYDAAKLTNQTGAALAEGDVAAISDSHDAGVELDDVAGSTRTFVVAAAAIASAAVGEFACRGYVVGVAAQGAIARGQWVKKSATSKKVEDAGTAITSAPPAGAIGFSVKAAVGGLVDLYLLGFTVTGGAGTYGVRGADCKNNATTPDTQFDLDADVVVLRDSGNGSVVRHDPGAAITNNVATAGPAANGRDQSAAFTASSWIHFYWIWNGTTLASISSAVAPPTGPTLPTGYTHWAYAGAVRFNASSVLLKTRIKGAWCSYEAKQSALTDGTSTTEATVALSTLVPPNALEIRLWGTAKVIGGGASGQFATIRYIASSDYATLGHTGNGAGDRNESQITVPNVSQQVFYIAPDTSPSLSLDVQAYSVANGSE